MPVITIPSRGIHSGSGEYVVFFATGEVTVPAVTSTVPDEVGEVSTVLVVMTCCEVPVATGVGLSFSKVIVADRVMLPA